MSEPFIIVYEWMVKECGLSGNELLVFALIHGYTETVGEYAGGVAKIGEWISVSRQHVYPYLRSLTEKGLIEQAKPSGGRTTATYISKANRPKFGRLEREATDRISDGKPTEYRTVNRPNIGHNNIRNIDRDDFGIENNTPLSPSEELERILTNAYVGQAHLADTERAMQDRIRELWRSDRTMLYGEPVDNERLRQLIRKLDRTKAINILWNLKRAERHEMIERDKREYYYSTIYNVLMER